MSRVQHIASVPGFTVKHEQRLSTAQPEGACLPTTRLEPVVGW